MTEQETPTGPTIDHASYLGGTDIAAVLGIHPYRTALDVWVEKVHKIETGEREAMRIGKVLERPILRDLYAQPRGLWLFMPGTQRHPTEPWMGATPDAKAGPVGDDLDRLVECKVVGHRQARRWGPVEDGVDGLPEEVLCQTTWQWATMRAVGEVLPSTEVVALLGTELRIYQLAYDLEFAANLMDLGRDWWKEHVEGQKMPEVFAADARKTLARVYPKAVEGMLEMRADVRDLTSKWLGWDSKGKYAEQRKGELSAQICAAIGEARGFEDDALRVLWSERKGSVSYKAIVDAMGVSEAKREEYRGDPTRVFRITEKKGSK